jgi:hypothetical protein
MPALALWSLIALIADCQVGYSQSLDEINQRQQAVVEALQKTPLTIRRALFVTEEPKAYGIYTPQMPFTSNRYREKSLPTLIFWPLAPSAPLPVKDPGASCSPCCLNGGFDLARAQAVQRPFAG